MITAIKSLNSNQNSTEMKSSNYDLQAISKLIDFVNLVKTPEEIMHCIYDDPASGTSVKEGSAIGLKAAQSILDQRKKLKQYSSIDQLLEIKGIGKDKVNDMLYSMTLTKLRAKDYLLLHDEEFQKSLKKQNKDEYKTDDCTFCEPEVNDKKGNCGCSESKSDARNHESSTTEDPYATISEIGITNPGSGVHIPVGIGTGTVITSSGPCSGTSLNGAAFAPDMSTPTKTIRVNLVIVQKEDGTGNFNEFDPDHNEVLNIAEGGCGWRYRNVDATGTGNGCNQLADSRIRFDFNRIYVRHSELWNLDENWTRNNGNPITPYACPNMSGNWPWKSLYEELRDQEDCNEEAITIFLVNSGVYLDDIQSQPVYVEQDPSVGTWLIPSPNYNLTNWSTHSPWVGGCSIFPSTNPHNTNRGHVILCKNIYYNYLRFHRIDSLVPRPLNWQIGSELGFLLSHELGHLIMHQGHTLSGGCGTNMMNQGGWQRYLNSNQLSRLHRVLSTTDLRRTVLENHPDREITSNQTWDRSLKIFGNIIIREGNTLTITCELEMPKDGRIIVERGARLDVLGGTITSRCGEWGSIEVQGNAKAPHPKLTDVQNGAYPNSKIHHGVVYLDGAIIENAAHAISTTRYESWGGNLNYCGGIVIAIDTRFRNIRRAVEFLKYDFDNISRFTNCIFETDPSAPLYFEHRLLAFVTMWAVRGVKFYGNTFINRDNQGVLYNLDERGRGIYSIDANYEISPIKLNGVIVKNEFVNLTVAIGSDGSSVNPSNLIIQGALIENCYQGIHLKGIIGARIQSIECNIGSELSNIGENYAFGIRIDAGKVIAIQNSQFRNALNSTGSQYGVLMQNCEDGLNWVYGCSFSDITSGIRAGGRNNWFLAKCNQFKTRIGDLYLDRDFPTQTPGEIAIIQSFHPSIGSANNEFTASTNNCANVGHHIHFDAFAAQSFIYLLPSGSTGTSYEPTCIINGAPWMFQMNLAANCPKSISQSKKEQKPMDKEDLGKLNEALGSLSKADRERAEMLMIISDALGKIDSEETDLDKIHAILSKFVKTSKEEKIISEISESASKGDRFMLSKTSREDMDEFLLNAGAIARARLDSMNALENMLS